MGASTSCGETKRVNRATAIAKQKKSAASDIVLNRLRSQKAGFRAHTKNGRPFVGARFTERPVRKALQARVERSVREYSGNRRQPARMASTVAADPRHHREQRQDYRGNEPPMHECRKVYAHSKALHFSIVASIAAFASRKRLLATTPFSA